MDRATAYYIVASTFPLRNLALENNFARFRTASYLHYTRYNATDATARVIDDVHGAP